MPFGRTVVARSIIGPIKSAITIDPSRHETATGGTIAHPILFAHDPRLLCEGGTNDGIRLVQQRRRRRARSCSSDCHGKQDGLYHDVPPRNQRLEVLAKRNPLVLRKKEKSSAAWSSNKIVAAWTPSFPNTIALRPKMQSRIGFVLRES
jgi:hypothetical protein